MTDQHFSSVLPFAAREPNPAGTVPADVARLLVACRDRLVHGVAAAFAEHLGSANDDLLGMADSATSVEQQQRYFAAMDLLTNRGRSLLAQFRSCYVEQFDGGAAVWLVGARDDAAGDPAGLSLGAADGGESDPAIGTLAAGVQRQCAEQLITLDRHLAARQRLAAVNQGDHPFYPRALFTAMFRACTALAVGEPLAVTILQAFARQSAAALPAIYDDINRYLVDCASPVEMPRTAPLSEPGGAVAGPSGLPTTTQVAGLPASDLLAATVDAQFGGLPAGGGGEDAVFGLLAHATAAANTPARHRAVPNPATSLGLAQLIAVLTSLQRGRADPRYLSGLGMVEIDPTQSSALQQLRLTAMAGCSHPVDALTIDIVAMLFEAIFDDPDLSATLRAEVARLQLPILKVALMDKAFFSDRKHPARRLLDLIASAGVGRNEVDAPHLMTRIEDIVTAVVAGFETDIEIFSAQVRRLEGFLANEDARAQARTTPVVGELAQRERQDLAMTRVAKEVDTRLTGPVPTLVAEFLDHRWRLVLVKTYVSHGDEGTPWTEALATMDDLLWSVAPKRGGGERNRLLTSLPDLLRRLRVPLESVGQQDTWDTFFSELIKLHMAALHKQRTADTWEPASPVAAAPVRPPAPAVAQAQGLNASELLDIPNSIEYHVPNPHSAADQPDRPNRQADRHLRLAQSLGVGTWVEFESFRGTRKTLRMNWTSQLRSVYLFTNRQGESALTLAPESLAEHLRKGTARVLSRAPLTERAVAHLLRGVAPVSAPVSTLIN
ncbi:DUF1631 domain-containing protein [uncultured Thiodictyon sp.]|uniref:DUF1631 domain-containing protein n=1 Tax=uncultured Thiodictyon sp. TaxID=1846217 RepID=UPI0025F98BC4|nr:DUF1631 domain-containing protein [uncultured Thiodictyon sp.]